MKDIYIYMINIYMINIYIYITYKSICINIFFLNIYTLHLYYIQYRILCMYLFINLFIDLFIYFLFIHSDRELQTHSIFSEEFLTFTYFLFSRTTYEYLCGYIQLGIFHAFPVDWKPLPTDLFSRMRSEEFSFYIWGSGG